MRPALAVFCSLLCLYALTAGGQGYSVDGQFAYQMADSVANDRSLEFARANASTLRRWGPLLPFIGVPFAWVGARLAHLAPPRDSVVIEGRRLALHDWPAIGSTATDARNELRIVVPFGLAGRLSGLRIVSYLSLSPGLPDRTPVADVIVERLDRSEVSRTALRAGEHTAEWAHGLPGVSAAHRKAAIAGTWPGNPQGLLYWADLPIGAAMGETRSLLLRYFSPTGRLHVRSVELLRDGADPVPLEGPLAWSAADQHTFFTRFAFSFVNAPVVALCCALLVPLARVLGYAARPALALGLGSGVVTPLWPYAKHDFAEPVAALCVAGATLLVFRARGSLRRAMLAGAIAALAAGARYTAVWLLPLLALHVRSFRTLAGFAFVPAVGLALLVLVTGRLPAIWSGASAGIAQGWLNFPLWNGLYGLSLSPGKGLLWYAPALLLALTGLVPFVRRHRAAASVFVVLPLVYALTYASKGVWHGGGWGPRYLVAVLPCVAVLALPAISWLLHDARRSVRLAAGGLVLTSAGVQLLGVLKHPNIYTVMFRDHVLEGLPQYGHDLGGPAADGYWRHFGGPEAGRQLSRPATGLDPSTPQRGLGYAYAEAGPLRLSFDARESFTLTLYVCDWDHRARRQRITVQDASDRRVIEQNRDFSACEYHQTPIAGPGEVSLTVEATEPRDVPVLSALFFDREVTSAPAPGDGDWTGRVGQDGYALLAWNRGTDVLSLPTYVGPLSGGDRVWIDTWQAELAETPLLYAPGFSPLLAHAWLLAADTVTIVAPSNTELRQRLLGSPPWRYVHGLEIHPARPEFGLGLDLWPLLLRTQFSSHPSVLAATWLIAALLFAGLLLSTGWVAAELRRAAARELLP